MEHPKEAKIKQTAHSRTLVAAVVTLSVIFITGTGSLISSLIGNTKPDSLPTNFTTTSPSSTYEPGKNILVVGGDNAYPPYSYLENGVASGFDNDLVRAVAEVMGVSVQFQLTSWAEAKQNLLDGKVDMLGGMAQSPERDLIYDFALTHSVHYSDLFVRRGSKIRSFEDIAGKQIIVQQGDIMHDYLLNSDFTGEIIVVENPDDALRLLASGDYDGALVNTLIGYYYVEQNKLNNLRGLNLHLMERDYGFVAQEGDRQLVQQLNEALAIVDATGQYEMLNQKWFSVYQRQTFIEQAIYFIYGFIAMAALVGLIGLWVWSLRRQVEARTMALERSEIKYRSLIDSASEGVIVIVNGLVQYLNPQAIAILELEQKPVFPLKAEDFVHPDDLGLLKHLYSETDKSSEPLNQVARIVTAKGGTRWLKITSVSIEWESAPAILGFFADITEARHMEESVQESEQKFRLLFNKSPVGLFYYNTDLVITDSNDQLASIFKAPRESIETLDFNSLEDKSILPALLRVLNREEGYYEGKFSPSMTSGKEELFISLYTTPVITENHELRGGIGLVEDITDKVLNQNRIKNLEERFTKAFLTSPDSININRLSDGLYYDINRGFIELTGYTRDDVIGKSSMEISIWVHPEDWQRLVTRLLADGEVKNLEAPFRMKDGTIVYGSMSASVLEIDEEKYIISITRDISDRKKAEESIRLSEARYRSIFETVPVAIMEEDFLQVYDMLQELRKNGVTDLKGYLREQPEFTRAAIKSVTVKEVNQVSLKMYEAQSKEELINSLDKMFDQEGYKAFEEELIAIWENRHIFAGQSVNRTLDGKRMVVQLLISFPKVREDYTSVLVSIADITSRKQAEDELRESEARYRSIFNTVPVSIWEEDFTDVMLFLEELRENGIKDLGLYLRQNPQKVREAVGLVKLVEVNDATVAIYGAKSKAELISTMETVFMPEAYDNFREELVAFWNKRPRFVGETTNRTIDGRVINIFLSTNTPIDSKGYSRVLVSVEDITERKKAEDQIRKQLEHLAALRAVDLAISASMELSITLRVLINQAVKQLSVDAASILLFNPETQLLEYSAGSGFQTNVVESTRLRLGESYAGKAAQERRIVGANDLASGNSQIATPNFEKEGFTDYIGIPLIAKDTVKGVLELFNRTSLPAGEDWRIFLESMARQAAIAIDNATLFTEVQQANINLRKAYDDTIEGWARALELRDRETEGHSVRVAELTVQLAESMGMKGEELIDVRRGALLHDIGKMGIPDEILFKKGKLTAEEWEIMHKHPVFARNLLGEIDFLHSAVDLPYSHHEKWDGSGYPEGLKGKQIPLSGRVFAVVDCWDALRTDRPYRRGWSDKDTWDYISENAGSAFDPAVVENFKKLLGF